MAAGRHSLELARHVEGLRPVGLHRPAHLARLRGLSNAKELTELVTKANTEAFNVISKRVTESLDEVRDFAKKSVAAR